MARISRLPTARLVSRIDAPERLLLLAEALATSVAFAYDERRITQAFDRVVPIASSLKRRKLLVGSQGDLVEQIGEALLIHTTPGRPRRIGRPSGRAVGSPGAGAPLG